MNFHIHINIARGHYIGQTRKTGYRRWKTVTGKCKTDIAAMSKAVAKMTQHDKRARVVFIDSSGWYEPRIVMEAVR
jgi:Ni2+-binding GTPase involved in maturation of urease and hydrogenase